MWKTACYYHVAYEFKSESTLYSCFNFKERLARNRHHIWSVNVNKVIRTHNHLVRKGTLNHLAKLASFVKWFSAYLRNKCLWVRILLMSRTWKLCVSVQFCLISSLWFKHVVRHFTCKLVFTHRSSQAPLDFNIFTFFLISKSSSKCNSKSAPFNV